MSKIDIFGKIRLFNEKIYKEDEMLNLNQYELSMLRLQFYFYKAPKTTKWV